jgi:OOP family OmpA-OmpF porin
MFVGLNSQAQDSNNPWAISFGTNAVDTRVSAASSVEDQFSQYFNVKKIGIFFLQYLTIKCFQIRWRNFSFGVTGSVNRIKRFVLPRVTVPGDYTVVNPGDLKLLCC